MAEIKLGEFYKSKTRIFFEVLIVGILLVLLFLLPLGLLNLIPLLKKNHNIHMMLSVFISGMLFHLACEYSGVNVWYSKDYCEIIPNTT
jgi:hypothetical protein